MKKTDMLQEILEATDALMAQVEALKTKKLQCAAKGWTPLDFDTTMLPPQYAGKIESDAALRDGVGAILDVIDATDGLGMGVDATVPGKIVDIRVCL